MSKSFVRRAVAIFSLGMAGLIFLVMGGGTASHQSPMMDPSSSITTALNHDKMKPLLHLPSPVVTLWPRRDKKKLDRTAAAPSNRDEVSHHKSQQQQPSSPVDTTTVAVVTVAPPASLSPTPAPSAKYLTPWLPRYACFSYLKMLRRTTFIMYRFTGASGKSVEAKMFTSVRSTLDTMCDAMRAASVQPVVVDIGANDGADLPLWFTGFAATPDSPCARANVSFAFFEPQARYAKQLDEIVSKFEAGRSVTLIHAAVGPEERHGQPVSFVGSGEQGAIALNGTTRRKNEPTTTVRLAALRPILANNYVGLEPPITLRSPTAQKAFSSASAQLRDQKKDILFLKLDCEGADAMILRDNEPLFAEGRAHFVMWEIHKKALKRFGVRNVDAVDMLRKHGYNVYLLGIKINEKELVLMDLDEQMAADWPPELETGIALSPTAQRYFSASRGSSSGRDGKGAPPSASVRNWPTTFLEKTTRFVPQASLAKSDEFPSLMSTTQKATNTNTTITCPWGAVAKEATTLTREDAHRWFKRMGLGVNLACVRPMHVIPCPECGGEHPIYH